MRQARDEDVDRALAAAEQARRQWAATGLEHSSHGSREQGRYAKEFHSVVKTAYSASGQAGDA